MIEKWFGWLIVELPQEISKFSRTLFEPINVWINNLDGPLSWVKLPGFILNLLDFSLIELIGFSSLLLIILIKIVNLVFAWLPGN